jgi:hypothetical protein
MPNRVTHLPVGGFAGMTTAALLARNESVECVILESIGGLVGGIIGGITPDLLEPATSPWHRKFCHSYVAGGGGLLTAGWVTEWQVECRRLAAEQRTKALTLAVGSQERSMAELMAVVWSVIAGVIVGLLAGYGSHLVLDATTERGLPLLGL